MPRRIANEPILAKYRSSNISLWQLSFANVSLKGGDLLLNGNSKFDVWAMPRDLIIFSVPFFCLPSTPVPVMLFGNDLCGHQSNSKLMSDSQNVPQVPYIYVIHVSI